MLFPRTLKRPDMRLTSFASALIYILANITFFRNNVHCISVKKFPIDPKSIHSAEAEKLFDKNLFSLVGVICLHGFCYSLPERKARIESEIMLCVRYVAVPISLFHNLELVAIQR